MGGGNSSQTATQARPASNEETKESQSSFKAFKGKGAKLGTDLSKSAVAAKMEQAAKASNRY